MQTLKELQDFYSSTLCHRFFEYQLANGDVIKTSIHQFPLSHFLKRMNILSDIKNTKSSKKSLRARFCAFPKI